MRRLTIALAGLFLLMASPAFAAKYFLDNSVTGAADSNTCVTTTPSSTIGPCLTLLGVIGRMIAGDVLYIGSHHVETVSTATNWAFPGTSASPNKVFAVNDGSASWTSGTPVTADLTDPSNGGGFGAPSVSISSGTGQISGNVYVYGMTFAGTAATAAQNFNVGGGGAVAETYKRCLFEFTGTGSANQINLSFGTGALVTYVDSEFSFGATTQFLTTDYGAQIRGNGLGPLVKSGSSVPINLFSGLGAVVTADGVDFTGAFSSTLTTGGTYGVLTSNSLQAGTSLGTASGPSISLRAENIATTATDCALHWNTFANSVDTDTTNFRTGGMTCDSAGISYKLTSTANESTVFPVAAPPIDLGHLTSGSSTTITLYFLFDGANNSQGFNSTTLNNGQLWMRVGYAGSSGSPINSFANNAVANQLPSTSTATQGTAGGTWTTSGLTTPETYSMSVTFTPLLAGHYELFVEGMFGASGKIVWIDPQFTCTGNCS